jgi:hypothetical protein
MNLVADRAEPHLHSAYMALARSLNDPDWSTDPAGTHTQALGWPEALPTFARHGLLPALAQRLRATPRWPSLAPSIRTSLERASQTLAAREMVHRAALDTAGTALARHNIRTLVIKGEALARTHYPRPALRERGDIDLWVDVPDFDAAAAVLVSQGWRPRVAADGTWSLPERSFDGPNGAVIDLHRRLFSQPLLARALTFEEVWQAGASLDASRAPFPSHALLIAALHRIAHHAEQLERWVWLWDVHVLVQREPACLAAAMQAARSAGVAALLGVTLRDTARVFDTPVDVAVVDDLIGCAQKERSARLLRPMGGLRRMIFDVRCAPDWRAAWTMLGETLFPRSDYMQAQFGPGWLPQLHARRLWRGLRKALPAR